MARTRWEPPFHAAVPRIGAPGVTHAMVDARGIRHSITLDADGYLWPTTTDQVRLADQFGIPVATTWTFPRSAEAAPTIREAERPAAPVAAAVRPVALDDLDDLTVTQLRDRADELSIDVPAHARKADLVAAITDARAFDVDEPDDEDDDPDDQDEG